MISYFKKYGVILKDLGRSKEVFSCSLNQKTYLSAIFMPNTVLKAWDYDRSCDRNYDYSLAQPIPKVCRREPRAGSKHGNLVCIMIGADAKCLETQQKDF